MSHEGTDQTNGVEDLEVPLNAQQLRAFRHGVGARIMPVHDGWKVDYFSVPDFELEPGTTYASLQDAVETLREWLPKVNSEEERAKAAQLEELLWLQLQEKMSDEDT